MCACVVLDRVPNNAHGGNDLHSNRDRHRFSVSVSMVAQSQMINDRLVSSDVTTCSTKRFCECAHQNVHVSWINAIKVANATTVLAQCTNGVSFVDVKIKLFVHMHNMRMCEKAYAYAYTTYTKLLFELHKFRQIDHGAFH